MTLLARKVLSVLAAAATVAAIATPAAADGGKRRVWRGYYSVNAISRNVITPYYVGYYGGHYSYYSPGPYPNYMTVPGCWHSDDYGYRIWVC
jgi:spore germination protein YaaH